MKHGPRLGAMLGLTRAGAVAAGAIVVVFLAIAVIVTDLPASSPVTLGIRLASLWGLLAMGIAALMSPFLAEIRRVFGAPLPRSSPRLRRIRPRRDHAPPDPRRDSRRLGSHPPPVPSPAGEVCTECGSNRPAAHLRRRGRRPDPEPAAEMAVSPSRDLPRARPRSDPRRPSQRFFFGDPFLNVLFLGLGVAIVGAFVAKRWQRRGRARPAPRTG